MQKENLKSDKPNNEFAAEFLDKLYFQEPKELIAVKNFFTSAFVQLSNSPEFDQRAFRVEWSEKIEFLDGLCSVIDKFSKKEIDKGLDYALGKLATANNHGNE